jgi:hypothetical protein
MRNWNEISKVLSDTTIQLYCSRTAILVWSRLKELAYSTGQTVYQLKYGLLSNYLIKQLKRPTIAMSLAQVLDELDCFQECPDQHYRVVLIDSPG